MRISDWSSAVFSSDLDLKGKHGTFELSGVPKSVIGEFSQRREEILDRATQLGVKSPEGLREITKRSRDPKLDVEDREALKQSWVDRAAALGFDGKGLVAAAEARAGIAQPDSALERGYCAIVERSEEHTSELQSLMRIS